MPDSLNIIIEEPTVSDTPIKTGTVEPEASAVPKTILFDSLTDTLATAESHPTLVLIEEPTGRDFAMRNDSGDVMSWLMLIMVGIFITVCFRYKNNFKYIKGMISDLTEIRSRSNMFDDTVRESSFIIALNVMCIVSVALLFHQSSNLYIEGFSVLPLARSILISIGVTIIYYLFLLVSYWICGNVFGDSLKTSIWLKGFTSNQGLLGVILFPISLISMFYAGVTENMFIIGAVFFILGKIIFIFKGFRIFFTEISSWLLFLYYLCSVEIIPMIFAYFLVEQASKILI